ncbi:DUF11 domain-containing protein [Bacillus pacificus]
MILFTYTVTFQNLQTVQLTDIVFTDPIPTGATFIPNSVTINGTQLVMNSSSWHTSWHIKP